ncbi:hypothetical protein AAU57_08785 [Nonlabens sp. YIK11]|uniref:hypothetical protein n=1 Tax=Nonlabens sp. YIK11 TaxID=1453349 RepID=UPI0006DC3C3C|nr:hypothetical protein [Nonlabens sp. YIK11]KQC33398.1 hypothetical protein AAU57_08785 [Nonlabens sp. YIK11]
MYELLKQICNDNNWVFQYARKDYANLFDEVEQIGVPHLFVDPIRKQKVYGDMGELEETKYSGSFMLLLSSDIDDEDYDTKYQNNIKPIATSAVETIENSIRCTGDYSISVWDEIEVINVFDYSFDGLLITYQIND